MQINLLEAKGYAGHVNQISFNGRHGQFGGCSLRGRVGGLYDLNRNHHSFEGIRRPLPRT